MPLPAGAVPGIDVSHYQAHVDWASVAADGVRFGFCQGQRRARRPRRILF